MKPIVICLLLCVASGASVFAKEKETVAAVPTASVDQVRWGTPMNDAPFDKTQLAGKVVVVERWGVNCPPCIASLPELAKLAKSQEKNGLVVVGQEVQGGNKEQITKLLDDAKVKYPVQSGGGVPVQSSGIPHALVFDTAGKLVWTGNPHSEGFEKAVKAALRGAKGDTNSGKTKEFKSRL